MIRRLTMPIFKLPLSGDVVQTINPWTAFMSPIANPLGLINVTVGQSSDPAVEADVLSDVAGYGKQLGRIENALLVLLAHFRPATPLTKEETAAIDDLNEMLQRIADVKNKHKREAMRPYPQHASLPDPPQAIASQPSLPHVVAPVTNSSEPAAAATSRR